MQLLPGQQAPLFKAADVFGDMIDLRQYAGRRVMLSFYRFSSCPFCSKFLINPDLTIHRAYDGEHIGDHIGFEEIEKFLSGQREGRQA